MTSLAIVRVAEENLVEERYENMVAHTGGMPTLRLARFLKPSEDCLGDQMKPMAYKFPKRLPQVDFMSWRCPHKKWKEWVDRMIPIYGSVWKKASIYDSIIISTYKFGKDRELILGLADSWCQDTNSFVLSWGEATLTLEDMSILGGFTVLGEPVMLPLTDELQEIEEKLIIEHKKCNSSKAHKAGYAEWIERFMGNDDGLEHVAFLSLWLSRCVFPARPRDTIGRHVFPIAIHLCKGTRIALAPSVLASLYRDLRVLKEMLVLSSTEGSESEELPLSIWAPFQMLQLWAWERFPCLQPTPNILIYGETRAARWHEVRSISKFDSVRSDVNSQDEFLWRPYSFVLNNWQNPEFYKDQAEWVILSTDIDDEEFLSFSHFIAPSELVGLDCIEQYLPHRVGMQFGMDQDIPAPFTRANANWEIAWKTYEKPMRNTSLYFPPRLFESDVTVRYFDWWNEPISPAHGDIDGVSFDPMNSLILYAFPEPKKSKAIVSRPQDELESFSDEDKMTISEWLQCQQNLVAVKEGEAAQVQSSSSTTKRNINSKDPVVKIADPILNSAVLTWKDGSHGDNNTDSADILSETYHDEVGIDTYETRIPGLELEARIDRLEMVVDKLKVLFGARKKKTGGRGTPNA
ncbi:hypothetical protein ACHQM5_013902 [Ranunculus cassubicifolius]